MTSPFSFLPINIASKGRNVALTAIAHSTSILDQDNDIDDILCYLWHFTIVTIPLQLSFLLWLAKYFCP